MSLGLPPSSHVDLLPLDDPQWPWDSFERFCLGLVRAQPDVADANLFGTKGQKQQGIDIEAVLTNGRKRTYQCRKWVRYSKSDVEKTITDNEYDADEQVIVVACTVSPEARTAIAGEAAWSLKDKEDLSRSVREIQPRERARRLVEDTFTVHWRRAFLGPPGPLAFWEPDDYFRALMEPARLFRHTWELVGRDDVLRRLDQAASDSEVRVVTLVGRGGIGKTRLLRALAERQVARRTVLFADESVPLAPESVEELAWDDTLVIIDDAHRRDDLDILLGHLRRHPGNVTVLLSTRPQRVDELRSCVAQAGFSGREVCFLEPLDQLADADVEALAREALGAENVELAEALAAATRDCPLVTVVGGQLLAKRAVAPALLERHADFRETVLERFRDEMLGRLSDDIDQDAARRLLTLVAALAPLSTEDMQTLDAMAGELGRPTHEVRLLLSALEEAGLLLARGRLRRIVPDVLGNHILHRACVDRQGRPTGYSDALLQRYGRTCLVAVLSNLAELDWRVTVSASGPNLLEDYWRELQEVFATGNVERRLRIIELVEPIASYQPGPILALVRTAMECRLSRFASRRWVSSRPTTKSASDSLRFWEELR